MENSQTNGFTLKKIIRYGLTAGVFFGVGFASMVSVKLSDNLPAAMDLPPLRPFFVFGGGAVAFFTAVIVCIASLYAARKIERDVEKGSSGAIDSADQNAAKGLDMVPICWAVSSVVLLIYACATGSQNWSPVEMFMLIPFWCGITAPLALAKFGYSVYKASAA